MANPYYDQWPDPSDVEVMRAESFVRRVPTQGHITPPPYKPRHGAAWRPLSEDQAGLRSITGYTELPLFTEAWISPGRGDYDDCIVLTQKRSTWNLGPHGLDLWARDLEPWFFEELMDELED